MANASLRTVAMALAAGGLVISVPAAAAPQMAVASWDRAAPAWGDMTYENGPRHDRGRHRGWDKRGRDDDYRYRRDNSYGNYRPQAYNSRYPAYSEPVYNNTRVWRGDDGRAYCRKSDGTTGLLIGGAAGALLGREVAGRGDRTLGAILGAAGGALLGKSLDSKVRCN